MTGMPIPEVTREQVYQFALDEYENLLQKEIDSGRLNKKGISAAENEVTRIKTDRSAAYVNGALEKMRGDIESANTDQLDFLRNEILSGLEASDMFIDKHKEHLKSQMEKMIAQRQEQWAAIETATDAWPSDKLPPKEEMPTAEEVAENLEKRLEKGEKPPTRKTKPRLAYEPIKLSDDMEESGFVKFFKKLNFFRVPTDEYFTD
jgi:hypothetical protein